MPNFLLPAWWLARPARWLALLAGGMVAVLSFGLVLEHAFGVLPCPMCWWQRYAHAAILGLALAALVAPASKRTSGLAWAICATAMGGLAVALWQFAAQHHLLPYPASCTATGTTLSQTTDLLTSMAHTKVIPCNLETFQLLGLSLAGWNIPTMLGVIAIALLGRKK